VFLIKSEFRPYSWGQPFIYDLLDYYGERRGFLDKAHDLVRYLQARRYLGRFPPVPWFSVNGENGASPLESLKSKTCCR
jgi:hypothetical protein